VADALCPGEFVGAACDGEELRALDVAALRVGDGGGARASLRSLQQLLQEDDAVLRDDAVREREAALLRIAELEARLKRSN